MPHPNANLYLRLTEAFHAGDVDALRDALSPELRWREAGNPLELGRAEVLATLTRDRREVQGRIDVHDVLADDEHVVAMIRVALRTDDGAEVDYPAIEVLHVADGLITDRWAFMDASPPEVDAFFSRLGRAGSPAPD